jgi:hypothetical protein
MRVNELQNSYFCVLTDEMLIYKFTNGLVKFKLLTDILSINEFQYSTARLLTLKSKYSTLIDSIVNII